MNHLDADSEHRLARSRARPVVAPLDAFGRDDLDLAGGKGANLGELVRQGFPVPGGFVVTTDAYSAVVEGAGLAARIAGHLAAGESDGAAIRADFAAASIPDAVRAAVLAAYADLGGGAVAVRSSATAEDLPGAAFAGQQDTYLNVMGDDALVEAVANCWASLWTERAIAYRGRRGIDSGDVRIAVVVQTMVEAETAGVLFSANPVTGERAELVVDASAGLGEAVVSGLVTPDHYRLASNGRVTQWTPGRREVVIHGAVGGGVTHERAESAEGERLPDAVLRELAKMGSSVAAHFGRPQDMEWAYADGQVYLLQARPMTALPPPPVRLNFFQRRAASVVLDYLPERPYPLDLSTWMRHGPLGMIERMFASIGLHLDLVAAFREVDDVVYSYVPPVPHPTPRVLGAPFRLARRVHRYDPRHWMSDPRYAEYWQRLRELAARDLPTLSWDELMRMPRELLALVDYVTDLRIDYLPHAGRSLARLRLALPLLRYDGMMSDLLIGPTTTTAANDALAGLAGLVRDDADLRTAFDELDGPRLVDVVRGDPRFSGFRAAFEDFLDEYGHRETTSPIMVSPPTWRDAPETVLDLVRGMVDGPATPTTGRGELAMRRLLASPAVRRLGLRRVMERWVDDARAGVALREDTHFQFTRPLPLLRQTLLEIGRRLRDAEVLHEPFDVFHLRLEELTETPEPSTLSARQADALRGLVVTRAAKRDELSGVRMIDMSAVFGRGDADADALVSGTPGGSGRVTGTVRVIRTPAEFGQLAKGDVLVCPYTNPAWTPLFQRASAVVVDTGGPGSHAAIVAREYGIPAVMGTGSATSVLTDGQQVTVDGDLGHVLAAES